MSININDARAFCHDCNRKIGGGFLLEIVQFGFMSSVGEVSGYLVEEAADHHEQFKKYSIDPDENEKLPKHDEFTVMSGDKVLGEMEGAATFGRATRFIIEDQELLKQFHDEIRDAQKRHHYGPEF